MLAKPNRVVRAEDFRATMRRGRRVTTEHAVFYLATRQPEQAARFGFVIPKNVGGAVSRNLVRRRLRGVGYELVEQGYHGSDVVIRVLPGSDKLSWTTLRDEVRQAIERGTQR